MNDRSSRKWRDQLSVFVLGQTVMDSNQCTLFSLKLLINMEIPTLACN